MTAGDSAVALELDKSSSRHRAVWTAPAGDFVLRTTNLRSWIAADAEHLHQKLILQFAGYRQKESVLSETSIFNRILRKKTLFL